MHRRLPRSPPRAYSATYIEEYIQSTSYEPIEELTRQPTQESAKGAHTGTHIETYSRSVPRSFRQELTLEHLQELTQTPEGSAHTSVGFWSVAWFSFWVRGAPGSIPGAADILVRMFHIWLHLFVEMLIGSTNEFIHVWFVGVAVGANH